MPGGELVNGLDGLGGQIIFYVVFLVSVTAHEAAHAWAALRGGDPTAYWGGQVSLDPWPHLRREPFGMVVLPILSLAMFGWPFGYASTPYDLGWAQRYPRRAGAMAMAGPLANLVLVVVAALVLGIGNRMGLASLPERIAFAQLAGETGSTASTALVVVASTFYSMNLLLFVLNLIPVPPLDGSAAVGLVLPEPRMRQFQVWIRHPAVGLLGILIAWRLFGMIFGPIFGATLQFLYIGWI